MNALWPALAVIVLVGGAVLIATARAEVRARCASPRRHDKERAA